MPPSTTQISPINCLMGCRSLLWLLGALFVFTLLFRRVPEIDLETAALFFDDGFRLAHDHFWRALRKATINFTIIVAIIVLLCWVARLFTPEGSQRLSFAKLGFATVSLLLGPLLVTNALFKEQWGRPRPKELEIFGGDAHFVLPWDMSDQCITNCSFVSGETSSAVWLLTLIPLLPLAWHKTALCSVVLYIVMVSGLRIAFGGHFLSDVIFSILLNMLVIWWVWGVFFERDSLKAKAWATETRIAGPLYRLGTPFRRFVFIQKTLHLITSVLKNRRS